MCWSTLRIPNLSRSHRHCHSLQLGVVGQTGLSQFSSNAAHLEATEWSGRVEDIEHNGTPWPVEDDVITNYQSKFIKRGLPVHALWVERI